MSAVHIFLMSLVHLLLHPCRIRFASESKFQTILRSR